MPAVRGRREQPEPIRKGAGERFRAGKSAIRDALIRLESHGVIRRRHGARLDANRYALRSSDSYTFRQEFTEEVETLEVRPVILDAATAEVLQTGAQTPAMYLVRLLMEAGALVALGRTTVPLEASPAADFDEAAAPRDVAAQLLGEKVVWLNVIPPRRTSMPKRPHSWTSKKERRCWTRRSLASTPAAGPCTSSS